MSKYVQLSEKDELSLVEKVQLRFILCDTDRKFESFLDIFLSPLILKLASPYESVRKSVLESLNHIFSRLKTLTRVEIPVESLLEQAKNPSLNVEQNDFSVRLYSLLFSSKGIDRLDVKEQVTLIPKVINNISKLPDVVNAHMFHILCKLLLKLKLEVTDDDKYAKYDFFINEKIKEDIQFVLQKFTQFFLLVPMKSSSVVDEAYKNHKCPGLSVRDVEFFTHNVGVTFNTDLLNKYKNAIFSFLVDRCITDTRILIKFLCVVSADSTNLSDKAVEKLKSIEIPYEDADLIDFLIGLYIGNESSGISQANYILKIKILSILTHSIVSTTNPQTVSSICLLGLNSSFVDLKISTLNFIQHVSKCNYSSLKGWKTDDNNTVDIASIIRDDLYKHGWPILQSTSSIFDFNTLILQRRLQYETLGEILKKDFSLVENMSYIEFLIDSLKYDLSDFRSSIQYALGSLIPHLSSINSKAKQHLKCLIKKLVVDEPNVNDSTKSKDAIMLCKYIAIKYNNMAFPFNDPEARLLNVLATSKNNRTDVIEEAFKGLHPYWFLLEQSIISKSNSTGNLCSENQEIKFVCFSLYISKLLELLESYDQTSLFAECLPTSIEFAFHALVSNAIYGNRTVIIQDQDWLIRLEKAIEHDDSTLDIIGDFIFNIPLSPSYLKFLNLIINEFVTRDEFGNRISLSNSTKNEFGKILFTFIKHSSPNIILALQSNAPKFYRYLHGYNILSKKDVLYAVEIYSILIQSANSEVIQKFLNQTFRDDDPECFPHIYASSFILSRLSLKSEFILSLNFEVVVFLYQLEKAIDHPVSKVYALNAFTQMLKFGTFNHFGPEIKKQILGISSRIQISSFNIELLTVFWACLTFCHLEKQEFETYFHKLYDLYTSKQIEILFCVGDAMSIMIAGWNSKILKRQTRNNVELDILKKRFPGFYLPLVLNKLLTSCRSSISSLRKASCIWLLSIVQNLGDFPDLNLFYKSIHGAFMILATDRDELIQELASMGLSIIYELSDSILKEELIKSLCISFSEPLPIPKITSDAISMDSNVLSSEFLNTSNDSIPAYKDILILANEIGKPGLVYKFIELSKGLTLWSSRRNIELGLGAVKSKAYLKDILKMDETLFKKLIPKLFRYKHDPTKCVADSMCIIWSSVVDNSSEIVNKHSSIILDEILMSITKNEWKVRQASVNALIELIQIVPDEMYEDRLENIWTMCFRCMDDIKETIREIGFRLAQTLSNILIKNANINTAESFKRNEIALNTLIPFLLGTKGLNSDVDKIRDFSLKTLLDLMKFASPSIKSYSPTLLYELILLLSSSEPQMINYLSLNSEKLNIRSSDLDIHRLQHTNVSPLMDSIKQIIELSDERLIDEIVLKCARAFQNAIGLPSKVGISKVISLLILKYSMVLQPNSGKLLKICFNGMCDKNAIIACSFASSLGHVYKISKLEKAVKYSKKLVKQYFESDDQNLRKITGIAVESIFKFSSDQFENVNSILMPLAFIAKYDNAEEISEIYARIWTDASLSGSGTMNLYLKEITDLVSYNIKSNIFAVRKTCAQSIKELSEKIENTAAKLYLKELIEVLLLACSGRSWDGKEIIVSALISVLTSFKADLLSYPELVSSAKKVILIEISRNNSNYLKKIIFSYATFLHHFPDVSMSNKFVQISEKLLEGFEVTQDLGISSQNSNLQDATSEINKELSKNNIQREEFTLTLLRMCANAFYPYKDCELINLFDYAIKSIAEIFDSSSVTYTWRSQIAAPEIGIILLNNFSGELSNHFLEKFLNLWRKIFTVNNTKEAIQSVKIQTIRFGGQLKNKTPTPIRHGIENDLRTMAELDDCPIVAAELSKIDIPAHTVAESSP